MGQVNSKKHPYALQAGEGWIYRFGVDFTVKAGEMQPGNGAACVEYITRKGEEPAGHTHQTEDEMFYVLDGWVTFQCGDEFFDLQKGGFIFLPHGLKHSYLIHGEEPVHLLVITSPARDESLGGWGGFVSDMESGQAELIAKPKLPGE